MWKGIKTNDDIKSFMDLVCYFHDGCIKEMHYLSGAYVGEGLGMYPLNDKRILKVIIQRQFDNPSMVELEFSGLQYMNLNPVDPKYTCEILGSTILEKDGFIYWCDDDSVDAASIENYDGTLICAEKLRWRPVEGHMGKDNYFIVNE